MTYLEEVLDSQRLAPEIESAIRARRAEVEAMLRAAVAFGRAYNPRMNPPLAVYDYRRPCYEQGLVLNP